MWSRLVLNCIVSKSKAYSSKKYQKVHDIASQKLSYIDQKYEKWRPNEKFSINCKHFGGGSYMFIYISGIGHLTLC